MDQITIIIKESTGFALTGDAILQIIVALAAVGALVFSIITQKQVWVTRRSFLVPADVPGAAVFRVPMGDQKYITLILKNTGMNPICRHRISSYGINFTRDANQLIINAEPVFRSQIESANTLAPGIELNMRIVEDEADYITAGPSIDITHGLIVYVEYEDATLKKPFNDVFYWDITKPRFQNLSDADKTEIEKINLLNQWDQYDNQQD